MNDEHVSPVLIGGRGLKQGHAHRADYRARFARLNWRAWIETVPNRWSCRNPKVSPVLIGGRGLKHGCAEQGCRHTDVSPTNLRPRTANLLVRASHCLAINRRSQLQSGHPSAVAGQRAHELLAVA